MHGGAGMSGRVPTKNEEGAWLWKCVSVQIGVCARASASGGHIVMGDGKQIQGRDKKVVM